MDTKNTKVQLGFALEHVSSLLVKQLDQVLLEQLGIGYAQFKILKVLWDSSELTQRQVAGELGQTEASISRQIKLLHNQGFLKTQVDPFNRKQRLPKLTNKGHRFTIAAEDILGRYEQDILEVINPKEQNIFHKTLTIIHEQTHDSSEHIPKTYQDLLEQL